MYEYDFTHYINTNQLLDEIHASGLVTPAFISTFGSSVQIFFLDPLSDADNTTLSGVVANHVANPAYITLAIQTQVSILLSYLNNTNTTVANTARAVIVSNLAPNLPPGLLTTVNTQIAAILGH